MTKLQNAGLDLLLVFVIILLSPLLLVVFASWLWCFNLEWIGIFFLNMVPQWYPKVLLGIFVFTLVLGLFLDRDSKY